ncbi:MAG: hypothetical protein Q8M66_02025, partial [Actinomycetota bacterium]|nr:hypothetical protein [Actinomycetota bacterium]
SHPENTVLQACAGACAILSLRLDPDEMANQGVLLSAEGDYLRLRQLLRGLLDNPSECADLGSRAFTYMREKYNIDRMTNEYAHLIRSMF